MQSLCFVELFVQCQTCIHGLNRTTATALFQVERLMKRDKRTNAQAEAKVMAQMHLHMKEAQSDIIIDNSGDQNHSKQQVLFICMSNSIACTMFIIDFGWDNSKSISFKHCAVVKTFRVLYVILMC